MVEATNNEQPTNEDTKEIAKGSTALDDDGAAQQNNTAKEGMFRKPRMKKDLKVKRKAKPGRGGVVGIDSSNVAAILGEPDIWAERAQVLEGQPAEDIAKLKKIFNSLVPPEEEDSDCDEDEKS